MRCDDREEVALLVSAWIEILQVSNLQRYWLVALLVSAWIEIVSLEDLIRDAERRTPRECVD